MLKEREEAAKLQPAPRPRLVLTWS